MKNGLNNSPGRQLIRYVHEEKRFRKTDEIFQKTTDKKTRKKLISQKSKYKNRAIKNAISYYQLTGKLPHTIFRDRIIAILGMDKPLK